ncbi:hypothetical protein BLNAU_24889 [Blattamonas nauphoetae]|uniref:Uncharacterized protein n=1 Tax=Blattamonas nauphoetae TaxID=2049346 RepID=A0ABQ9WLL8_9EUKA|nr:hypothetical protein BLNAU_24889 [Blattamonas nauphoetae]
MNSPLFPPSLPSKPVFLDVHIQPQTNTQHQHPRPPWCFADVVSLFTDPPLTIDHKPVCRAQLHHVCRRDFECATAHQCCSCYRSDDIGFEEGRTRLFSGLAELHDRHPRQRPEDVAIVLACDGVFDSPETTWLPIWCADRMADSVIQRARLIIEADDDNAYTALDEDSGSPPRRQGKFAKFEALRV